MAELTAQERLQPALLDRLTDREPASRTEPREQRLITKQQLRQAVIRDLGWLFNATRPSVKDGLASYDYVSHSVLNFGLPALSGETASTLDVLDLEARIHQAIVDFEPRIDAATLQVKAVTTEMQMDQHNVISVLIRGNLWAQPVPLELLLRTEVDLESGAVRVRDQFGGSDRVVD
jgi:type VI secretion system protein ImpF